MFFRALTVSSFILIAWLTLESTKLKSLSIEANNRAVTLEQHLRALQQVSLKNQSMIRQQLTQQNDLLVLEQKVLKL